MKAPVEGELEPPWNPEIGGLHNAPRMVREGRYPGKVCGAKGKRSGKPCCALQQGPDPLLSARRTAPHRREAEGSEPPRDPEPERSGCAARPASGIRRGRRAERAAPGDHAHLCGALGAAGARAGTSGVHHRARSAHPGTAFGGGMVRLRAGVHLGRVRYLLVKLPPPSHRRRSRGGIPTRGQALPPRSSQIRLPGDAHRHRKRRAGCAELCGSPFPHASPHEIYNNNIYIRVLAGGYAGSAGVAAPTGT